jgi:benzil reductase ((S)-benzoin forming)
MLSYYIITGTSRGIGKKLAEDILSASENNVVYGYSRSSSIKHKNYFHQNIDLSDTNNLSSFELPEIKEAEKIVLINNSGTLSDVNPVGKIKNEEIIKGINLNLTAPIVLTNNFISKYSTNTNCEKIVFNISSGAAIYVIDGWSVYCATKAALNMFTDVAAAESKLHQLGFKHFSFAPGKVDTQMQTEIRNLKKNQFSMVQNFIEEKEKGSLNDVSLVSKKIISILGSSKKFESKQFWTIQEINN